MKFVQLALSVSLLCLVFACSDPCDDLDCGTGICNDGTCDCPDGFSGVNCEIEDLCFDAMCNNGSCNSDTGACECNEGYEGTNCESLVIAKFVGTWVSTDFNCDGDLEPVTFIFEQGATITDLRFYDLEDDDIVFNVNYDGNNLTIPEQEADDVTVSGSGDLTDPTMMSLNFLVVDDIGDQYNCSGTFTKQ